jgi:acetyl-CoA carboxylase carboxyl transferase subunit alpha
MPDTAAAHLRVVVRAGHRVWPLRHWIGRQTGKATATARPDHPQMADIAADSGISTASRAAAALPASGLEASPAVAPAPNGNGAAGRRHVLEFEKPLTKLEQQIEELEAKADKQGDTAKDLRQLRTTYTSLLRKMYDKLGAWEIVQVARHPQRPLFKDYVDLICREFRELHGDRHFGDDPAIRCGLARIGGQKVMLIGHHKGRDTKEKVQCYFGLAHPEGYRKALRCMKLAEKFGLPVVTLIDTPGAYPGIGAEERGQAESIARNMLEMSQLRTPIVSIVTGEGGSGGALGIGVADRIGMLEFAWYSVISPEACSAILYDNNDQAATLAESLKLTSRDLKQLGIVDTIISEPLGGAHRDPHTTGFNVSQFISRTLRELKRVKVETLLERRYDKFRAIGEFREPSRAQNSAAAG